MYLFCCQKFSALKPVKQAVFVKRHLGCSKELCLDGRNFHVWA